MVREKRMVEKERMCEAKVSQRYEELKQFEKDLKKKKGKFINIMLII